MKTEREQGTSGQPEDTREIAKWARTYAQNRTLGVAISLAINVALCLAIGVPSYVGGYAYRYGNTPLLAACIVLCLLAMIATVFFSVPRWGGMWIARVTQRVYAQEGNVSLPAGRIETRRRLAILLVIAFGACILAAVALGGMGFVPLKYQQPVSAIYTVPFLIGLWFLMRPAAGFLSLLWPALYGLHAILIVAGAPILLSGPWEALNVLIPIAGYGMLTAMVGHLYSRFALHRLRKLSATGFAEGHSEGEES